MLTSLKFSFQEDQHVNFLIEDDKKFGWIKNLNKEPFQRYYIYIDKNIKEFYEAELEEAFSHVKKPLIWIPVDADESIKSLDSFVKNVLLLEKEGLNRYDSLVVIGGGVLIDLVSFIASTYMRGVPLILIPTTLMGQVDASTAGKTCINSPNGKNLVGTLYFAKIVYINTTFIKTLPGYELRQAFSEIFKYSLLNSIKLLDTIVQYSQNPDEKILKEIIIGTIKARINIRNVDPLASNLGHTFGHAFESLSNYEIGHGDSIAAGLLMAISFGEKMKITKKGAFEKVRNLMTQLKLNMCIEEEIDFNNVVQKMQNDKKSSSSSINLVMIKDFSAPYRKSKDFPFYPVDPNTVLNFLHEYKTAYPEFFVKGLAKKLKN